MGVFDLVADAAVAVSENVENRQDLAIVWHQGFPYHLSGKDQFLDNFKHGGDDFGIAGVEGGFVREKILLMGMISCGITGSILFPPLSNRSYVPIMAKER